MIANGRLISDTWTITILVTSRALTPVNPNGSMILSGDRNLTTNGLDVVPGLVVLGTNTAVGWSTKMHNQSGNFGLADGSVQKGSGGTFQIFLSGTGTNVTRLAVP